MSDYLQPITIGSSYQNEHPLTTTKGRVFKGPTVNAYTRQSLGSIPSSVENMLFKKPKNLIPKLNEGYNLKGDNLSISFRNGTLQNNIGDNYYVNSSTPLTSAREKIITKRESKPTERFNYNELQKLKYYPGPGDYNPIDNKKSLRYSSLYDQQHLIMNTEPNDDKPGPGSYNVSSTFSTNVYISPFSRFTKKRIEEYKKNLGPGSYNNSLDIKVKQKNKLSSFFVTETNKRYDNTIMQYVDDHNAVIKEENKESARDEKNQKSDKQIKIRNLKDIKDEIMQKRQYDQLNHDLLQFKKGLDCQLIQEDIIMGEEKKCKGISFKSNVPKIAPLKNQHIPGPCYYNPPNLPTKKPFNANHNNKWM